MLIRPKPPLIAHIIGAVEGGDPLHKYFSELVNFISNHFDVIRIADFHNFEQKRGSFYFDGFGFDLSPHFPCECCTNRHLRPHRFWRLLELHC